MMHYIRDEINNEVINVIKVPFEIDPADILTNHLPTVKFKGSLTLIGVFSL